MSKRHKKRRYDSWAFKSTGKNQNFSQGQIFRARQIFWIMEEKNFSQFFVGFSKIINQIIKLLIITPP